VFVGAGDLNGDGDAEVVTGAGAGGGPHVKAFDGAALAAGGSAAQTAIDFPLASFFAYDASFNGGVSVAVGTINGVADIVTGGGGPPAAVPAVDKPDEGLVRVFDGSTPTILAEFHPYGSFAVGANVTAADVNGDGTADIITGVNSGGPNVKVFDGTDDTLLTSFYAFDPTFLGGVYVG
jgi:serralysin